MLGPEYVTLIDGVCRDLQAKTTIELAVVTVGDLGGLPIEDFAEKLFRRFAIGAAGKDNGLLLLCSRDDRAVRLEVGYGLEAAIPDALASRLLDTAAVPYPAQRLVRPRPFPGRPRHRPAAAAASGAIADHRRAGALARRGRAADAPGPAVAEKEKRLGPAALFPLFRRRPAGLRRPGARLDPAALQQGPGQGRPRQGHRRRQVPTILAWIAAVISFLPDPRLRRRVPAAVRRHAGRPGLATAGQLLTGQNLLKRRLASYRLPCAQCGAAMDMVADSQDDKFLTAEEAAEEKAGGMDYEFWRCPKCGADEKLAVKLGKAAKCPQCKRRTLTSSTTTLVAATKEQGGRTRVTRDLPQPQVQLQQDPRARHAAPLLAKLILLAARRARHRARSAAAAPAAAGPARSSRTIQINQTSYTDFDFPVAFLRLALFCLAPNLEFFASRRSSLVTRHYFKYNWLRMAA